MQLIDLHVTPLGNQYGNVLEATISPDINGMPSDTMRVARHEDGAIYVMHYPDTMSAQQRDACFKHGLVIIDMVYDLISHF
ncbi:MAG: hypothetical protein F6K62_10865 [Sphaerospermopsis sp. SIO1G2]|nr:hypothetical protein [Sphaerospermopsis sp. SIO1G2]